MSVVEKVIASNKIIRGTKSSLKKMGFWGN
jgi:hypothetical protein